MYAVFIVSVGWNAMWGIPTARMIGNRIWNNWSDWRLAIFIKVIMPLILVFGTA